jgi:hypothetical protein
MKVSCNILYCVMPLTFSQNVENHDLLTAYKFEHDKNFYGFTDMSEIPYYLLSENFVTMKFVVC